MVVPENSPRRCGFHHLAAANRPSHRTNRNPVNGSTDMLAAASRFLPVIRNFTRQIVPPVVATLLAAVLIAGYNRAFTGHLVQPRMGMLHGDVVGTDEAPRPAGVATVKPREATDAIIVAEPVSEQNRVFSKDNDREAAKDDAALKTAAAVAEPAPVETTAAAPAAPPTPPI